MDVERDFSRSTRDGNLLRGKRSIPVRYLSLVVFQDKLAPQHSTPEPRDLSPPSANRGCLFIPALGHAPDKKAPATPWRMFSPLRMIRGVRQPVVFGACVTTA